MNAIEERIIDMTGPKSNDKRILRTSDRGVYRQVKPDPDIMKIGPRSFAFSLHWFYEQLPPLPSANKKIS